MSGSLATVSSEGSGEPRAAVTALVSVDKIHHVGIRVVNEDRAVEFYGWLGFRVIHRETSFPLVVLMNEAGIELHLVVSAGAAFDGRNVLADLPEKYPGHTHVAFRVASIQATAASLRRLGVRITDGPRQMGPGIALIARDPDANVLELREETMPGGDT